MPIKFAREFINSLNMSKRKFLLVTNCPSNTPKSLVQKLGRMDIEIKEENVLTSGQVTASYLQKDPNINKVFLLGGDALKDELEQRGLQIVDDNADCVVVGYDRMFTYEKMEKAVRMILDGAKFIATNSDPVIPCGSTLVPHTGALYVGIEAATGIKPLVMGKPEHYMLDEAVSILGCQRDDCCVIGDRLDTDIAFADRHGISSYLVLTGVTGINDLKYSAYKPTYVFNNLNEVIIHDGL